MQEALLAWYALQWRRLHTIKEGTEQTEQEQARKVRQLEVVLQGQDEQIKSSKIQQVLI